MRVVAVAEAMQGEARPIVPGVRPATLLRYALLVLWTTQLGRIPALDLGRKQALLFLSDLGVMLTVTAGAIVMMRRRSLRLDSASVAGVVFAIIGAAAAFASISQFELSAFEVMVSLAYLARWMTYFALYVVIINCVRMTDVPDIWKALEWTVLAFAAFGILQSILFPDFNTMLFPDAVPYVDIDPQGRRLVSTLLEPNVASALILTVLLVQLAKLAAGVPIKRWKAAVLLLALVLTLSRSGVAGFVVGGAIILAARGVGKRMLRFSGAVLFLALLISPLLISFANQYGKFNVSGGSGFAARMLAWRQAIDVFAESPWYGIGFNTYGFVQDHRGFERMGTANYSVEGGLLFVAVMTGVIGLAVYVTMLWLLLRRCRAVWRDARSTREERGLATGTAAATVAVVVHSVFVNSLLVPFVMEPLWVLSGLTFVVSQDLRRRSREVPANTVVPAPRDAVVPRRTVSEAADVYKR
jgi:hypothetical protein